MVGGKATDDGGRIVAGNERGGERDGRAGATRRWLDQDIALRQPGELAGDRCRVGRSADDERPLGRHNG